MPDANYEIRYLQACVGLLEDYLLSSDLFWPAGVKAGTGQPPYPQFTLAGLLLFLRRAQARTLSAEQQDILRQLEDQVDQIRTHWRVAWGKKAAAEFRSRLNLWKNYIAEYREFPAGNYQRYGYEVARRAQLQLLGQDADDLPSAQVSLLQSLDRYLQSDFLSGEFIWEAEIATSFPRDPYWYLYGKLKGGH